MVPELKQAASSKVREIPFTGEVNRLYTGRDS